MPAVEFLDQPNVLSRCPVKRRYYRFSAEPSLSTVISESNSCFRDLQVQKFLDNCAVVWVGDSRHPKRGIIELFRLLHHQKLPNPPEFHIVSPAVFRLSTERFVDLGYAACEHPLIKTYHSPQDVPELAADQTLLLYRSPIVPHPDRKLEGAITAHIPWLNRQLDISNTWIQTHPNRVTFL